MLAGGNTRGAKFRRIGGAADLLGAFGDDDGGLWGFGPDVTDFYPTFTKLQKIPVHWHVGGVCTAVCLGGAAYISWKLARRCRVEV